MLEIIPKNTNIDFVGKRYFCLALSAAIILATTVLLFTKGLNYGIDFTGGAEVQLTFKNTISTADLRATLEQGGFKNLMIQSFGDTAEKQFLVKMHGENSDLQQTSAKVSAVLATKFGAGQFEVDRVDVVGPQAGSSLRKSGFLSLFYTLLCILVYVAIRFDYRYSPGAVLALFHDTVITLGVFILTQKEFSLQIIAAILTIIGYSNNDTIIVYDRIRETIKLYPNRSLHENINRSINETLSRTILTSVFTLFVVTSLMVFGGGVIHDFAFTMFIGIIVGTYSSIFIASPVLIFVTEWQKKRAKPKYSQTSVAKTTTVTAKGKSLG